MLFRYSYDDYLAAKQNGVAALNTFLKMIVEQWKGTEQYRDYQSALKYSSGLNEGIMNRVFMYATKLKAMKKNELTGKDEIVEVETMVKSELKANYQIANDMFGTIMTQKVQYLLGNGVNLDVCDDKEDVKEELGEHLDRKVQIAGMEASMGSVAWAYYYLDNNGKPNFQIFNTGEFIPLINTETNVAMVGVRFWEVPLKQILYIELYEQDGMTRYKVKGNIFETVKPKTTYKRTMIAYPDDIYTLNASEVFELPIVPFYNNIQRKSDFNKGLRNKLDLYDIILSDFGNNLTDANDVYWVLENYKGQDVDQFKRELNVFKTIRIQNNGSTAPGKATPHTTEIPYNARQTCLDILRKQIYSDTMALDTDSIKGGSLTNVAIKAAYANLDQKANNFEWGALDFVTGLIKIWKLFTGRKDDIKVNDFTRRALINDEEIVKNLVNSPYLSNRTKRERNPYSADDEEERVLEEQRGIMTVEEEDDENIDNTEVKEE